VGVVIGVLMTAMFEERVLRGEASLGGGEEGREDVVDEGCVRELLKTWRVCERRR